MELKDYLVKNGLKQKWFAEKIGIRPERLSDFLKENRPLPLQYFNKVVRLTNGKVTLLELLKQNERYYKKNDKRKHKNRKWKDVHVENSGNR